MSLLIKLLGFTGMPPWALELVLVGAVGLSVWGYHLHVVHISIAKGVQQQLVADDKATQKLNTDTDKQTAQKLAVAEKAAADASQELDEIKRYVASHAQRGSVCDRPTTYHRSPVVPERGPAHSGDADASPGPTPVLPLYDGTNRSNAERDSDQLELLQLFAARADEISASLREFQARNESQNSK